MPDSVNDPDIVVRTQADLASAQAAEAQLELEIAQAKDLGQSYHLSEIQLESLRAEILKFQQTFPTPPPSPQDINHGDVVKLPPPTPDPGSTSLPAMMVGLVQAAIRTAQSALSANKDLPVSPISAAKGPSSPDKTNPPTTEAPLIHRQDSSIKNPANTSAISGTGSTGSPQLQPDAPPLFPRQPTNAIFSQPGNQATNEIDPFTGSMPFGTGDELSRTVATQSQSLQDSGERLRAAVEQNTSLTNSLFLRTLDLIDQHNRKLGDVDRKISELSNQIKSLKNP